MFKRIKGFIRMKREQRELRSRMSKETYMDLSFLHNDLDILAKMLDDDSKRHRGDDYEPVFLEYSYKIEMISVRLDDIMHAPKRP